MSHTVDVHRRHVPGIAWAIREIEDAENQHHRVIRRLGTDSGRRTTDAEFHSAGLPLRGVIPRAPSFTAHVTAIEPKCGVEPHVSDSRG